MYIYIYTYILDRQHMVHDQCEFPLPYRSGDDVMTMVAAGRWHVMTNICWFPSMGVPQNGWFIRENPTRTDDVGVPLLLETPIWVCLKIAYRYPMMFGERDATRSRFF